MRERTLAVLERLRNPAYTGENRCTPCTAVNVGLALVVSGLAALLAIEFAAVVLSASLLAIYLRGYLVPGTPTLTERYLPDWLLATVDKGASRTDAQSYDRKWEALERLDADRRNRVDPDRFLREVGAIERRVGGDHSLTDTFASLVDRTTSTHREEPTEPEAVAAMLDVEPEAVGFPDREYLAIRAGSRVRGWPSKAALLADVATHAALTSVTDRWETVPLEQRLDLLRSLRSFREACPRCEGELSLTEERVDSCCRSLDVVALSCERCGETLCEFDPDEVASESVPRGVDPAAVLD